METVGFIGVGKIGLPICENLIKSGYRVLGYRRGSLEELGEARRHCRAFARRDRRPGRDRALVPAVLAGARGGGARAATACSHRRGPDR